jgi:C4-dicarboxylate transporter DctM subunit
MAAVGITILLFVFIGLGMPMAFAIGAAGCIGIWSLGGLSAVLSFLATTPLSGAAHYELMTIPMFVLMAEFVIVSGVAEELFDTIQAWVQRIPGGLGVSTILTGAGFSSICGSSAASAATLASTAIPQMTKHGYDKRLANGLTAIVGTLSSMIPPANGLIIYGILSEVNLSKLLLSGFFPGLLAALVLTATLQVQIWRNPGLIRGTETEVFTLRQKLRMLGSIAPMMLLLLLVTCVLYLGIGTPTEAASVGAAGAMLLAAQRGRLTLATLHKALKSTARTSTMITMIIIGAYLFGYFLTMSQATQEMTTYVAGLDVSRWVIIAILLAVKLLLGCFMDQAALLVLTVPVTLPIIIALGFDPIWYGIVLALTSEIGLVTPPIGLNVFIVARYTNTPVDEVFAGVAPYMLSMFCLLVILAAFPDLVLWVPNLVGD